MSSAARATIPSPIRAQANVFPRARPLATWLASHWPYGVGVVAAVGTGLFCVYVIDRDELHPALAGHCGPARRSAAADRLMSPSRHRSVPAMWALMAGAEVRLARLRLLDRTDALGVVGADNAWLLDCLAASSRDAVDEALGTLKERRATKPRHATPLPLGSVLGRPCEGRAGLYMTVSGDTENQLRDQLLVQAQREAGPACGRMSCPPSRSRLSRFPARLVPAWWGVP